MAKEISRRHRNAEAEHEQAQEKISAESYSQFMNHVRVDACSASGSCCAHSEAHFEDKPWLSPETARRLSFDASLVTLLEDDAGNVLNVGRRPSPVPAHIRRALSERATYAGIPAAMKHGM